MRLALDNGMFETGRLNETSVQIRRRRRRLQGLPGKGPMKAAGK